MQATSEQYKGYTIAVTPHKDCEDMWDFEYRISRNGAEPAAAITRSQTAGGHLTPEVACLAGLEVARIEIDNLLALGAGAATQPA
jgi:hypothetical protein